MWPWSAAALKEQLDRIERNQLRIAAALKINEQLEQPPLGLPARVAPRAPRRKLTEADVHFAGRMPSRAALSTSVTDPAQTAAPPPPSEPSISPQNTPQASLPLASSVSERLSPPSAPPSATAMHWRDSGSLTNDLP